MGEGEDEHGAWARRGPQEGGRWARRDSVGVGHSWAGGPRKELGRFCGALGQRDGALGVSPPEHPVGCGSPGKAAAKCSHTSACTVQFRSGAPTAHPAPAALRHSIRPGAAAQACRLLEAGSWARPSVRCSTQADAVAGLGPCRRVTGGDALANVQTAAQGLRAHRQHPGLLTAPSWPWLQPLTARGRCGSRSARGALGEAPGGSLGLCLPGLLTVVMPRRGSRCSRGWKPEAPIGAGEGSGIQNGFQGFQGTHWCLLQPPRLFLVIYGPPVVVSLQSREQKGILRIIFPSQCPPGHSLEPRRRGEDAAPPQNAAPQHGPEGGLIYVSQTSGSLQWLLSSPYPRGMAYFPRCAPRVTLRPPGGRRLLRHLKGAP